MNAAKPKSPTKKPKLVRDSFSIPKAEYAAIDALKTRAVSLGTTVKKSELLRAGLMALQGMGDTAYQRALAAVPALKTGRPATATEAKVVAQPAPTRQRTARKAVAKTAVEAVVDTAAQKPTQTATSPAAAKRPAVKKSAALG